MTLALSVLLVTRNAGPFVDALIVQARAAEREFAAEVIAVDGGSTDGTWEALSRQTGWTVRQQQSTGLPGAREEARALSSGRAIAYLDADDVWLPGKTAAQLAALDADPDLDIVSCHLRRVAVRQDSAAMPTPGASGNRRPDLGHPRGITDPEPNGNLIGHPAGSGAAGDDHGARTVPVEAQAGAAPQAALTPSGCVIRAEVFERIGGFDTRYSIASDHEWFVRAQTAGLRLTVLPAVLMHKGIHLDNLSHDRSTYRREFAQVLRSARAPLSDSGDSTAPAGAQAGHDVDATGTGTGTGTGSLGRANAVVRAHGGLAETASAAK